MLSPEVSNYDNVFRDIETIDIVALALEAAKKKILYKIFVFIKITYFYFYDRNALLQG